jgi:hypothetical protein
MEGTETQTKETKKPKQGKLPGFETKAAKEIHDAAEALADVRAQRMDLQRSETDAQDKLIAIMRKHKQTSLVVDGLQVELVEEPAKTKAKVKRLDANCGDKDEE